MTLRKTKSGQSAKKIRSWKYEDQMSFLKDHFQDRQTASNISESSSSQDSQKGSPPRDPPRQTNNEQDVDNIDGDEDDVNDDDGPNQRERSLPMRGPVVKTKKNGKFNIYNSNRAYNLNEEWTSESNHMCLHWILVCCDTSVESGRYLLILYVSIVIRYGY